ncbi:acyl-CoA dehydrogenase family protein [Bordetella bronchiseptica]|uniref:acyl-CoA dehydrogenase family protein n=1 Tax=Bordetella bronchiseptica TaxID=518 RepID=UPI003EDC2B70
MSSPEIAARLADPIPDSLGQNLYLADADLPALLSLYLAPDLLAHLTPHLHRLGELAGGRLEQLAAQADKHTPELVVRTRQGHDCSEVVKHPAYVELERWAFSEFGLAAASHAPGVLGWHEPLPAAAKYTLFYLFSQSEYGLTCPVNMTDSFTRTLKKYGEPALVQRYLARLTSLDFDTYYQGAMFMTEQGAGSDIAQTAATARRDGEHWLLSGDKWFCSNASADLAMVLARPDDAPAGMAGVSLFLMPRVKADGTPNAYRIIRLKDKLGTRSMASGEIRLEGAQAYLIGEVGKGFQQMAEMVNSSRLSNGVRSGALMRRALSEASYVAEHRRAFGKRLVDLPLIRRQLDKMRLMTEQARTFAYHTAQALRGADEGDETARRVVRIMTPLIKFRACRDARKVTGDAMEVRGGCGYIEEWPEARLLRDAHLGSIWEGTSNIVALDVYRAINREDALTAYEGALRNLLGQASGTHGAALAQRLDLVCAYAARQAGAQCEEAAREVASALYHVGSAIQFAWEASQGGQLAHRHAYAADVLAHRLDPQLRRAGLLHD